MEWIKIPIGGVVVKNDDQVVRVVIKRRRPIVKYKDCEFYARSWQGTARQNGELVTWEFPMGPIRLIRIHNNRWINIVWK